MKSQLFERDKTIYITLLASLLLALLLRGYSVIGRPHPSGPDYGQLIHYANLFNETGDLPKNVPYFQLGATSWAVLPGAPLVYALLSAMTSTPVLDLMAMSLTFGLLEVAGAFLLVWRILGRVQPALLAGLLTSMMPSSLDMMGWSGYPNLLALGLMPYLFLTWIEYLEAPRRSLLALTSVVTCGVMSIHLLSTIWIGLTLGSFGLVLIVVDGKRHFKHLLLLGATVIVLGLPIWKTAVSIYLHTELSSSLTVSGSRFMPTHVNWEAWTRLVGPLAVVFLSAGGLLLLRLRTIPLTAKALYLSYLCISLLLSFGWSYGFEFYYTRGLYYLSIPIAISAVALIYTFESGILRSFIIIGIVTVYATNGISRSRDVADYYEALTPDLIEAAAWLENYSEPGDVVVTSTFWGFHIVNLLERPTMVALTPELIGNLEEVEIAEDAVAIQMGLYNMDDVIDKRNIRFVLVKKHTPDVPDPFRTQTGLNAHPRVNLVFENKKVKVYEVQ